MMSDALDVMGFSHDSYETIYAFHKAEPGKPLVMTECCSCETQRGEDDDLPRNASEVYYSSLNGGCLASQTQTSNAQPWMGGTFVWVRFARLSRPLSAQSIPFSFPPFFFNPPLYFPFCLTQTLHDYAGEPGKWPHVSSSFGAIDFAGIPKSAAWW